MKAQFEGFEANWQRMELWRDGDRISIKPRAMELLQFLYENRERVVSKEEIFETVWQGRIVTEGALTTALNDLRRSLRDSGKTGRIVRTIYGRGLRFVAELENGDGVSADRRELTQMPPVPRDHQHDDGLRVLAVLPFEPFSDDPDEIRFASFIARDVVTRLSGYRDLRVLSPGLAEKARGKSELSASHMGANYVVEGSAWFSSAEIAISVQLSDAGSGMQIWANRYTLPMAGGLERIDYIASSLVGAVIPMVTAYEYHRHRNVPDDQLSAVSCLYRGRYVVRTASRAAQDSAIALFEQSIARDPGFGAAHAALASALCNRAELTDKDDARSTFNDRARASVRTALELEPDSAPGWYTLARCFVATNEPAEAVHAAETAVRLNELSLRAQYILGLALWQVGQAEKALAAFDAALHLASTDVFRGAVLANRACALVVLGRYDEAIDCSRRAQQEPGAERNAFFGEICGLIHLGRFEEVPDAFNRACQNDATFGAEAIQSLLPIPNDEVQRKVVDALKRAADVWRAHENGTAAIRRTAS